MIKSISNYKVLIALLLLLFSVTLNAQIYISGSVTDVNTSIGVPGHTVYITTDTSTQQQYFFADTIYTNGQGLFVDTIFPPTGVLIKFYMSTIDCNQNVVMDSMYSVYPLPVNIEICTGGMNMCLADFVAYPDTSNHQLIHFYNISSTNITSSTWSFGDGAFSINEHPSHLYNYGTFLVCLNVVDTVAGCNDTYCDSLKVSPIMSCSTSFVVSKLSPKKFLFSGSSAGLYPTLYYWDFGDGNSGDGKNVTHEYSQPGTYIVNLKSVSMHPQTLDTCISFSQSTIAATGPPSAGVWGQVFADTMQADSGQIFLYSYDQSVPELLLVDSIDILKNDTNGLGSYYEFSGLPYGKYVTYLKLKLSSSYYSKFAPAYSGNTIYWNEAYIINLNQISTAIPINLTHIYPLNGNSTISGHAYEGSKKSTGDPVSDVPVFLLDKNKSVVGFTYTNSSGYFIFDSLTTQKYYIYSDVINHIIYPAKIEVTNSNQHIDSVNIYVSSSSVTSVGKEREFECKVFPNPTKDIINIHFANNYNLDIEFNVFNIIGQDVLSKNISSSDASIQSLKMQKFNLDVSSLNAGVYFLQIKLGNKDSHIEKIIISK